MENCKFCNQELEEGSTLCPHCGRDNAEASVEEITEAAEVCAPETEETQEKKAATPGKIALAVGAVIVLVAILIAIIAAGMGAGNVKKESEAAGETTAVTEETAAATIPADGNPDDATCKGSYTVTDEEAVAARDIVVATIGEHQLTNGRLQAYYWNAVTSFLNSQQGYYLMMYGGFDYKQPLDTQKWFMDDTMTWQQFFLRQALENWQTSCALATEAEKAGMEMTQEEQDFLAGMEAQLEQTAASYGMSVEELLKRNIGPGAGVEDFIAFQTLYTRGNGYYADQIARMVPTQEDLRAFYEAHAEDYASGGVDENSTFVNVRHILLGPEGGTEDEEGKVTYSEEELQACRDKAQELLDQWLAGKATEDSFAALANEHSQDPGSNTQGGLYEKVAQGQMVEPFDNWIFDESRQTGDYGIVETQFGCHIMYFVSSIPQWEYFAKNDWLTDQISTMIKELAETHPMEVDYSKIVLGFLDLAQ